MSNEERELEARVHNLSQQVNELRRVIEHIKKLFRFNKRTSY